MKNTIKLLSLFAIALILFSCKGDKGEVGPVGPQGESGPAATKYSFTLTFDNSTTYKQYSGLVGKVGANDAVLVYALYNTYADTKYYTLLPFNADPVYFFSEIGENGDIFVNAVKSNGTSGSPFSTNTPVDFQAVVIKGNAAAKLNFDVDLKNFEEVCEKYNLK